MIRAPPATSGNICGARLWTSAGPTLASNEFAAGGSKYAGSVFRISLGGKFTSMASFFGGNAGAYSYGRLLQSADGNFYGTTVQGGVAGVGTIFRMNSSGAIIYPYSFGGGADGAKCLRHFRERPPRR